MTRPPLLVIRRATGELLFAFLVFLLPALGACASQSQGLVAWATSAGTGDARTDGDAIVVVGDVEASLGVRTATGLPIFLVPPVPVERGQWYARSSAHGYERRAPLSEPLPWWARPLYLEADLERLAALGMALTFEPPPPEAPPAPAGEPGA